jgi:hydrogenase nickel incorporation protein HypB
MKQVDVRKKILSANDAAAEDLRRRFDEAGTLVPNLISAPGSGKTALLEATARRLAGSLRIGAIVGDIATEMDADRLRTAGLPAHQILTSGACHLDARMVADALGHTAFPDLDLLFIENVGNLVCPTSYLLGEDFKVVLLSVTEGQDKPFKYPAIFTRAAVTVVTKADLLPHVEFDVDAVHEQVLTLNPQARFVVTSIKGQGLDEWCKLLGQRLDTKRAAPAPA